MRGEVLINDWWRHWWRESVKRRTVWRLEAWLLGWVFEADAVRGRSDLLAECDCGDIYMPSRTREGWWDRLWCWWKPTHWPAYLRSRRARAYVMIEHEGDDW